MKMGDRIYTVHGWAYIIFIALDENTGQMEVLLELEA
tara:strand:+ start:6079 stop:6189 length:111 start_codon:yes stop_codon:yes gene_type:complete